MGLVLLPDAEVLVAFPLNGSIPQSGNVESAGSRNAGLRHGAFALATARAAVPEAGAPTVRFPIGGGVKMWWTR